MVDGKTQIPLPEEALAYLMEHAKKISWEKMSADMFALFDVEANAESWRGRWRRLSGKKFATRTPGGELMLGLRKHGKPVEPPGDKRILALVKGVPKTVDAVAQAMGVTPNVLMAMVEDLRNAGHELQVDGGKIWLDTKSVQTDNVAAREHQGETVVRILVVSDTHLCSKYQQLSVLEAAYDDAVAKGCDFAIHAGDLTDGFYQSRPGHIYEIFRMGFDEQLEYAVEKYPRRMKADGTMLKTLIIGGNHDATHMKSDGANLVKAFAKERDDVEYLGDGFCKYWVTPTCDIDIMHPLDGSAYAISYSPQKICDAYMGGEKPRVLLIGHHHKGLYMPYRNIHVFEVPTCQAQSPWMKGKRLFAVVGWWILTLHLDADGSVVRLVPEIRQCYEMRKDDY